MELTVGDTSIKLDATTLELASTFTTVSGELTTDIKGTVTSVEADMAVNLEGTIVNIN